MKVKSVIVCLQEPVKKGKTAAKRKVPIESDSDDDFVVEIEDDSDDDKAEDADFIDDDDDEEKAPKASKKQKTAAGKAAPVKRAPTPKAKAAPAKAAAPVPTAAPTPSRHAPDNSFWPLHTPGAVVPPGFCTLTSGVVLLS